VSDAGDGWATRGRTLPASLILLGVAGTIGHTIRPTGAFGQLTYLEVTVGAAVAAWLGVARSTRRPRRLRAYLATGVTLSAIADVIYAALSWSGSGPDVSIADVFWLATYLALFAGLLRLLLSSTTSDRWELDSLLDLGAMTVVALLVMWQYSVGDIVADSSVSALARVVSAAYPMLDAALLALVGRALVSRRVRALAGPWMVLGICCWLASDLGTVVAGASDGLVRWLDLGWLLGAGLLGGAVWRADSGAPERAPRTSERASEPRAWDRGRLVVGLLPLLLPGGVDLWMTSRGTDPDPIPLFVATIALAALAFARGTLLVRRSERAQALVESSQRHFRAIAANSSDAVIIVDRFGQVINEDPKIAASLGNGAVIAGCGIPELYELVPGLGGAAAAFDPSVVTPGAAFEMEVELVGADGRPTVMAVRAMNLLDDPDVAGIIVNFVDVTARRAAEQALGHQMLHDSMTGLANRALFRDRLEHALQRTARTGLEVAVVCVDLDGFRAVNDVQGHDVGDAVLRDVSGRLLDAVRSGDTVARLGADEFAILLEQSPNAAIEAPAFAERLLGLLAETTTPDGSRLGLTASIGITLSGPSSTAGTLQREADLAMNEARKLGRARSVVFEAAMAQEVEQRSTLERDLASAVEDGQLRLLYQPVIDLANRRIVGFEALVRWQHPTRGLVTPDVFIPLAESSGTIREIGRWVLDTACDAGARWQLHHPASPPLSMAVNVSGVQLASAELVADVGIALAESGLRPDSLVLELTETVLVRDPGGATTRLEELRALGARIAIDDFGTGYSSLSYLRQFPIDILKIDRSFVQTITSADVLPPLVGGLMGLATALGLETVAEGIEDEVQRDQLAAAGCQFAQGYLFARPLPVAEIDELLTANLRVP